MFHSRQRDPWCFIRYTENQGNISQPCALKIGTQCQGRLLHGPAHRRPGQPANHSASLALTSECLRNRRLVVCKARASSASLVALNKK
ncbi:hypothetical protein COCON_G00164600 [Conger conger]|uniref:Uncharacterized protein n=1 Tax=Conger conger TaxID=82655 RepID=A0A9Q1D6F1_CONCO|nr:hypothetical protein COCON_G00164600 [Conger conger]